MEKMKKKLTLSFQISCVGTIVIFVLVSLMWQYTTYENQGLTPLIWGILVTCIVLGIVTIAGFYFLQQGLAAPHEPLTKCRACGQEITRDAKFCEHCGATL